MSDDRRLDVLRAIVEDYVATQEPVGSRSLLERHQLGVSPATVRNDMAVLEEEGYITAPHTSAGRIPTDKGYRMFVDRLSQVKPISVAERRAIERFLTGAVDVDDVMQRSVKVLAQLTQQVAVVQYPSLTRSTVRHIEVVAMGGARLLLVVISSSGRVEQRMVELSDEPGDDLVADLRRRVVEATVGLRLPDATLALSELVETSDPRDRPVIGTIVATLSQIFSNERSDERVVVGGTAHLARFGDDFDSVIRPVLEALEEQVVLLKLLGEATSGISVRIGHETGLESLSTASVVASGYGPADRALANLGTVGPTRIDYPSTIAAVAAVSRYVGRTLNDTWSLDT